MAKVAEIAKITAQPGKRKELVEVLSKMVAQANSEAGTEIYIFHEAADDDVTVWTYELYADQAARDAHGASEAMQAIGPAVGPLLGGAPELIRLVPAVGKGVDL
jgi:quinol monooxygenase YgiN